MLRFDEPLDLNQMYVCAPPTGGAHPHKVVLYAPQSDIGSTVLITNRQDGWSSLSYQLAKRLGARIAQIIATQHGVEYPQVYFHAWVAGAERAVVCMRDSHAWVFQAQGQELPFEELSAYSARRVSMRLTRERALSYVRAMGWDAVDPNFWQTGRNAVYFQQATVN